MGDGRAAAKKEKIENSRGTAEKVIMIKGAMMSKNVPIDSQLIGDAI